MAEYDPEFPTGRFESSSSSEPYLPTGGSLYRLIITRAYHRQLWIRSPTVFVGGKPVELTLMSVSPEVKRWLSDVLQMVCHRVDRGLIVPSLSLGEVTVEDGYVRLPPPTNTYQTNRNPVEVMLNFFDEFFKLEDVESKEKEDLLTCLKYMLQPLIRSDFHLWFSLLRTLPLHFFFMSPSSKLFTVKYIVRYSLDHGNEMSKKLNKNWRYCYNKEHCGDKHYNITERIKENPFFQLVFSYGVPAEDSEEPSKEDSQPHRPRYGDDGVSHLIFINNVIKHANNHRRRLGYTSWTDDELELLIELDFPGEMLNAFSFFWVAGMPMNYGHALRVQELPGPN